MFAQSRNTVANVKVVKNKKLGLVRIVVAFNLSQRNQLTGRLIFPSYAKCAYVSGDFCEDEMLTQMQRAATILRTQNLQID